MFSPGIEVTMLVTTLLTLFTVFTMAKCSDPPAVLVDIRRFDPAGQETYQEVQVNIKSI